MYKGWSKLKTKGQLDVLYEERVSRGVKYREIFAEAIVKKFKTYLILQ